ncbi:Uma2 family endonuclease [Mangrovihabitans endophyticus]|uniref:Putative restriction endonuclease domain-containing protein n=1 Tax=Mangrovihabitans endophyticus TaxID=1751298 RepID=A0A8J3BZ97_9ACTN|nr:Uma2 family endonuclease [Mangrovihabitans endophyticus]GGK83839.1 hypothetical protein GCM10012284_17460 [Mangrovihabitans endophyticus]
MTAEAVPGHVMWVPDPRKQKAADHTIEDVLSLPDGAPRVELRDGVMIVVPTPTYDHQDIAGLLWAWLRRHAPREFRASLATGVAVSVDSTFEPDVLLVDATVEQDPVRIFAYDLVEGRYEAVADAADELVLTAPFEIKLPIGDITP